MCISVSTSPKPPCLKVFGIDDDANGGYPDIKMATMWVHVGSTFRESSPHPLSKAVTAVVRAGFLFPCNSRDCKAKKTAMTWIKNVNQLVSSVAPHY